MLIYEVNLEVGSDILPEVEEWLPGHVKEVLRVSGFEEGVIYRHADNDNAFSIRYRVTTMAELNTYLNNQAEKLRASASNRFPHNYKAWRRVLREEEVVEPDLV